MVESSKNNVSCARVALIIGSPYTVKGKTQLVTIFNDVRVIRSFLKRHDFKIWQYVHSEATARNIDNWFTSQSRLCLDQAEQGTSENEKVVVFVYYAGHAF
jgi:hypothetical protein